ncbi:MAG: response regulator [Desulfobacterales bacterium]|nr:response regulator [Desulfobacterales bacterium]
MISGQNILIVHNSESIRQNIKQVTNLTDVNYLEAVDGKQGLKISLETKIDLIITGIEMPQMTGLELCHRIKSNSNTRSIPVIMVCPSYTEDDIDKGFNVGASAYLSNNEIKTTLKKTVDNIIHKALLYQNKHILVVDDSKVILCLVEEGLAKAGFKVITTMNGKNALDILKDELPDLILSDIDMPVMNGFEFCRNVHEDPELSGIPFVVMSTNSKRGHMQRMLNMGAQAYIVKPFHMDELVILVEKLLSDHFLILLKEKQRLDIERNMMLASITSLVTALEARDPYTKDHSSAVADMLRAMAKIYGESAENLEIITLGGKLHDIGKIGISDSILLKPGRLTKEEFTKISRHPIIGANILKSIPSLSSVLDIVRYHHERFDGKGYPYQISGNRIPFWARVTAVADTYHALTSDRPYRQGMPKEPAFQIIEEVKGTQLCPDAVDLFFQWINSSSDEVNEE